MSEFQFYRKNAVQPMRPYVPGEDLTGVSVSAEDTPELGGMIAVNPSNPADKWYVAKAFFEANYELAALGDVSIHPGGTVIDCDSHIDFVLPESWAEVPA